MNKKSFAWVERDRAGKKSATVLTGLAALVLSACGGGGSQPSVESTVTHSVTRTSATAPATMVATSSSQSNNPQHPENTGRSNVSDTEVLQGGAFRSAESTAVQPYSVSINGHTHADGQKIVLDDFSVSAFNSIPTSSGGSIRAYRQQHSIIAGYLGAERTIGKDNDGKDIKIREPMRIGLVTGSPTQTLPETGKYTYSGQAFGDSGTGRLNYQVDFNTRKGSGSITGIEETGKIILNEADIKNVVYDNSLNGTRVVGKGIEGSAQTEKKGRGDYALTFFGAEAEEIGGKVYHAGGEIGVGGAIE